MANFDSPHYPHESSLALAILILNVSGKHVGRHTVVVYSASSEVAISKLATKGFHSRPISSL